ncbi:MFS domain-containing protein [Fusarium keratoplasticum]|uniref:MFS domain-containing protein n=1 Tax=Fusarium keratoplasticum TaxID=1328300 RepID=A0ACC0QXF8_9HYPO|nr:MFS domain-containing protein [Fusarium keratoplasticum]KAI8668856.1 MFS domain-containing protein [Fusarium keratoplasticum]
MPSSESGETMRDPSPYRGRRRSSTFSDRINRLEEIEAQSRYEEEAADRGIGALHNIRSRTRSRTNEVLVNWELDDPENPYNWSKSKKNLVLFYTAVLVINSTMGSALPSLAIPNIVEDFGITSQAGKVLPISVYLIGYVFGPIIWGPLSEHFGRRDLSFATFGLFTVFTMACALAPNWPALLIFRFFCGAFASSPIAIVAGILADVYNDPRTRGRAFAIFMVCTTGGPILSPIISGFAGPSIGWRWVFWIALIVAGVTLILIAFLPETYGPILLSRRARKIRREDPASRAIAPRDLESTDLRQLLTVVLTRPLRMLIFEPIVTTTCAYLSLVYTIFYMSFQAFPIIFQDVYGLSPGVTGLAYLPIFGGAAVTLPIFWAWDNALARATARDAPWVQREEYRRLPLACLGGPLFVISLFWLGWSAREGVSFIAPMLAGIPFGMGFMLIFMAMLNYLTDAYEIFAASANAAASTCRSLFAVVLPLATTPMFRRLEIPGACSLLGGLSALMCIIPFVFIWKGPSIRARSRFCIALRERKEEMQRKEDEARARLERIELRDKEDEKEKEYV